MRKKVKPTKGSKIFLIETYARTENHESIYSTIYYIDRKRRKVWEEEGLTFYSKCRTTSVTHSWAGRKSQRSMAELLRKYHSDFEKLGSFFKEYDIQATEVGVL